MHSTISAAIGTTPAIGAIYATFEVIGTTSAIGTNYATPAIGAIYVAFGDVRPYTTDQTFLGLPVTYAVHSDCVCGILSHSADSYGHPELVDPSSQLSG